MDIRPVSPSFKGNLRFQQEVNKKDLAENRYTQRKTFELNPNKITSLYEENIIDDKFNETTIIRDDNNTQYKFNLPLSTVKYYIQQALYASQDTTVDIPACIECV